MRSSTSRRWEAQSLGAVAILCVKGGYEQSHAGAGRRVALTRYPHQRTGAGLICSKIIEQTQGLAEHTNVDICDRTPLNWFGSVKKKAGCAIPREPK